MDVTGFRQISCDQLGSTEINEFRESDGDTDSTVSTLEVVVYNPDQDIAQFLISDDYPEFERQFREDLAVIRQWGSDFCVNGQTINKDRLLGWFEETIFDYRWPCKELLPPIYGELRSKIRCLVDGNKSGPAWFSSVQAIIRDDICLRIFYSLAKDIKNIKDQAHQRCAQAVFPMDGKEDLNKAAKYRLLEKFGVDDERLLGFSVFHTFKDSAQPVMGAMPDFVDVDASTAKRLKRPCPSSGNMGASPEKIARKLTSTISKDSGDRTIQSVMKICSVLNDFYFWVESEDGSCRCPELKDVLSVVFADRSKNSFSMLSRQAISKAEPATADMLLSFLERQWFVCGEVYELSEDAEIVGALSDRLMQDNELKKALVQVINEKKCRIEKNLTMWCREPEVLEAYLRNQLLNGAEGRGTTGEAAH